MREIKFRGMDTLGNIVYGTGIFKDKYNTWLLYKDPLKPLGFGFKEFLIMKDIPITQSTGMKDVNGKEIYEGDVIECFSGEIAIIVYMNGAFMIKVGSCLNCFHFTRGEVEVVGNIYEDENMLNLFK